MTLDEQILLTQEELNAYKKANFTNPEIIKWLESVLESLCELKRLNLKTKENT